MADFQAPADHSVLSTVSVPPTALPQEIQDEIAALVAFYRGIAAGALSAPDAWAMLNKAVVGLVQIVEQAGRLGSLSGADKKGLVLTALGAVIDTLAPLIALPGVPPWLTGAMLPFLKSALLQAASGMIDAAVAVFNRHGWAVTAAAGKPRLTHQPVTPRGFVPY